jgi:hypothetical protein
MWRRFAYQVFNIGANDKLCDHDMFTILEQFKLRDFINFYREIHGKDKISNNYKEAIDETDQAFFDALSSDYGIIAKAFNVKRQRTMSDVNASSLNINRRRYN